MVSPIVRISIPLRLFRFLSNGLLIVRKWLYWPRDTHATLCVYDQGRHHCP